MKRCPKCNKIYDDKSTICLGLFCARTELVDTSLDTLPEKRCVVCGMRMKHDAIMCQSCGNLNFKWEKPSRYDVESARLEAEFEDYIRSLLEKDEEILHIGGKYQEVEYISGSLEPMPPKHPSSILPERFILTNFRLIFFGDAKRAFSMWLKNIKDISIQDKERITATRILLTGVFAWALKKHKTFLVINYHDEIDTAIVFGGNASLWHNLVQQQRYRYAKSIKKDQ